MRTTLTIDDDILAVARCMAGARGVTLGEAVSILARRGIPEIGLKRSPSGMLVFDVPEDFPPVTDEMVRKLLEEDFP
jgi:hypothetical protein